MFDYKGHMRTTQKSHLKTELAVHKSHLGVKKNACFLDILWVFTWHGASYAVIHHNLNTFRVHDRRYPETDDVFLLFDRYIYGITKDVTPLARDKGRPKSSK